MLTWGSRLRNNCKFTNCQVYTHSHIHVRAHVRAYTRGCKSVGYKGILVFFFVCTAIDVFFPHPALFSTFISKTYLYNFDPLKPHFKFVKMAFTGVNIIFSYFCSKHILWVLVRTASQYILLAEVWKISKFFIWKFSFFGDKTKRTHSSWRVVNQEPYPQPHLLVWW